MNGKFISEVPGRNAPYRFRMKAWGIEKYFPSKTQAGHYRDRIVADLDAITNLIPEMESVTSTKRASNLIGVLNQRDYNLIVRHLPDLDPVIKRKLGGEKFKDDVVLDHFKLDPKAKDITVADMINAYVSDFEMEHGKKIYNAGAWHWWTLSPIANVMTEELGYRQLLAARVKLQEDKPQICNGTINDHLKFFYTAWTHKLEVLNIGRKAPPKVKKLPHKRKVTNPYTLDEANALIEFWYKHDQRETKRCTFRLIGPLIELAACTAIRNQFLGTLEWSHVSWNEKLIRRPMKGDAEILEHEVPLSERALDCLQRLWDNRESDVWVFPSARSKALPVRNKWYNTFRDESKKAGFKLSVKPMHGFRAMVATELHAAGVERRRIATILACTEKNLDNYIRPDKDRELADAQEALEDLDF